MKKTVGKTLALAAFALLAGTANAQIKETPHNLSTGGTGTNHLTTGTEQICVFCHTPHASATGTEKPPLWNKAIPSFSFSTYSASNSSTIDGAVLSVGSVSAACLSCHDGTQAMDNMINQPGSGGYDAAGASKAGNVWAGSSKITGIARLSGGLAGDTDLTNDHPIGIQYCGGGLDATKTAATNCQDKDFKDIETKEINGARVFWVDTLADNVTEVRGKKDIVLYTRDFTSKGGVANSPSVECASCHDPHVKSGSTDEVNFMRVTTAGSQICLACHTK